MKSLYDLIQYLQYGTKLHIGVLFFNNYGNSMCALPIEHAIHSRTLCWELKVRSKNAFKRCFRCRNLAVKKAMQTKKPFGGICINGTYEYTHPVVVSGEVACIIYIGNILEEGEGRRKLLCILGEEAYLTETLERNFGYEKCAALGELLEGYICMLFERYGYHNDDKKPLIENIKNYIEANLEYDIDISYITQVFHYNKQYLGRLFKKKTGYNISAYINLCRMERAKKYLRESNESVIDIAAKIGFNNVTYFNRVFKEEVGRTPTEYRKEKQKEADL